ncbi:MAG: hypothetical protein ACNI27_15655 [Desulfovibrio sp.]
MQYSNNTTLQSPRFRMILSTLLVLCPFISVLSNTDLFYWNIALLFPNTFVVLSVLEKNKALTKIWLCIYFYLLMGAKIIVSGFSEAGINSIDLLSVIIWTGIFAIWNKSLSSTTPKRISAFYVLSIFVAIIALIGTPYSLNKMEDLGIALPFYLYFVMTLFPIIIFASLPISLIKGSLKHTAITFIVNGLIVIYGTPIQGICYFAFGCFLLLKPQISNNENLPEDVPLSEATRLGGISNAHVPKGK